MEKPKELLREMVIQPSERPDVSWIYPYFLTSTYPPQKPFWITPEIKKLLLQNFLTINKYLLGIFCENVKKLYPNVYVIIAQLFNTHTHMRTHDSRPILW